MFFYNHIKKTNSFLLFVLSIVSSVAYITIDYSFLVKLSVCIIGIYSITCLYATIIYDILRNSVNIAVEHAINELNKE